jgi:hypothetical protein
MVLAMTTERSGEEKAARLRVGVIAGSTRPGRQSRTVAEWVCADPDPVPGPAADRPRRFRPAVALRASTSRVRPVPAAFHAIVVPADRDVRRVRPGQAGVQPFDERGLEERARSPLPGTARQARRVRRLRSRWRNPPVEHLRAIAAELGMAAVGPQVAISLRADYAGGRLEPRSFQPEARQRMLDQLARWATALRALRLRTTSPEGQIRPALDDPSARAAATSAVEQLVAGLQDGIDRACADAYDQQFASDVLWGNPFGGTVSGYKALNAAHHSLMAAGVAPPSRYQVVQLMSPCQASPSLTSAETTSATTRTSGSRKWPCTCLSNAAGGGGWPPARTPPSLNAQHDRRPGQRGRFRAS